MKKDKVRVIPPIAAFSIKAVIGLLNTLLVSRIPDKTIQEDIRIRLEPIKKMVEVLADKDPNNAQQVKEVWFAFLKSDEFNDSVEGRIYQAIGLIEDDKAREFVTRIAVPVLKTVRSLYDNEPDNAEQIKDAWFQYLTDNESTASVVAFFVKDPEKHEEISEIVDGVLETLFAILTEAMG